MTNKLARRLRSPDSPGILRLLSCHQLCSKKIIPHDLRINYIRAGTLSVKCYTKSFCNPWMITSLVELQQLCLASLTRSAELVGQRQSRTSERHGAFLTTSLAGQDTPPIIVPFQLMKLRHSFSET